MIRAVWEGFAMCLVLLLTCVVGIADGPAGMASSAFHLQKTFSHERRQKAAVIWRLFPSRLIYRSERRYYADRPKD